MNRRQTIKDIEKLSESLRGNLMGFGLDYLNSHKIPHAGIPSSKKREYDLCMSLRESVLYRIECINYHLGMLLQLDKQVADKIRSVPIDIEMQNDLLVRSGNYLLFFLDDLVFHIVSLFDYLGNLIGFSFYGEDKKAWKGVKSYCDSRNREKNDWGEEKIKNSRVCPVVLKYQRELMNKLEAYRAERFHYKKDSAEREISINLMNLAESKFRVEIPNKLKTWFKKNVPNADTIIDAAVWLVKKSFSGINEILIKLRQELKKDS